jgi:SAM-dependent methyltransferase/regulator of replication initiation timing
MRGVLERIRRLTVTRSVVGKLAELEARIGAADAACQELKTRDQTLVHERQALSTRNDLLRQNDQALNALYQALQAEHQALEAESESLNSRCKELQTDVQALRQHEQTLTAQHQLLQQSQAALNARYEALQSTYKILEIALQDLATRHQADLVETQRSLKEWSKGAYLTHRAQTAKIIRNIVSHRNESRRENKPTAERDRKTIGEQREALKTVFPRLFPIWDELFGNAIAEYEKHPAASLSVEGNRSSAAFGKFLSLYAHGSVLDVGCGIQEFPSYLDGLVIDRLAGIDPLASELERKFEFVQGFAEFLPWKNDEFDLVVAATSLDHVVSLDMALGEIKRVLRPGGYFVTWVGFVAGAKPYDPTQPNIAPIDRFHLFHFDRDWFVELMTRYFTLEEEFALDFESHFFAFLKA